MTKRLRQFRSPEHRGHADDDRHRPDHRARDADDQRRHPGHPHRGGSLRRSTRSRVRSRPGVPVTVTIRATDVARQHRPRLHADAIIQANTGNQTSSPTQSRSPTAPGPARSLHWSGGAVALTCADYSAPPKVGPEFVRGEPRTVRGASSIAPGQTALAGTPAGKTGVPIAQYRRARSSRRPSARWTVRNLVPEISERIVLAHRRVRVEPSDTVSGERPGLIPTRLHRSGDQSSGP